MTIRVEDSDGNVLGNDMGNRKILQAYADTHNTTVSLIDEDTGEVQATIEPRKRAHNALSFERVQVLVRVHKDDRQQILDAGRMLNKIRQEQSV